MSLHQSNSPTSNCYHLKPCTAINPSDSATQPETVPTSTVSIAVEKSDTHSATQVMVAGSGQTVSEDVSISGVSSIQYKVIKTYRYLVSNLSSSDLQPIH